MNETGGDTPHDSRRDPEQVGREATDSTEAFETGTFETGRYLFCLVSLDPPRRSHDEPGPAPEDFSTTGIDDEPAYLVSIDGIGAVVQHCESLFDSDDVRQVQRWLLTHQRVVDEAGETFGTPLPFQFDTILQGNDAAVRDWLERTADRLESELETFAELWEYRIQVTWADDHLTSAVLEANEELRAMRPGGNDVGEGTAFLREKQFAQRLERARRARCEELAGDLEARLDRLARSVTSLGPQRLASSIGVDDGERPEPFARFAVLAGEDRAGEIGDELDEIAAIPGVEVTYTGPWPPYTFSPELGESA